MIDHGLSIEEVRVAFGGLVAVDGVTLDAPRGRITGLIGPNGAGKTTTFNACSGVLRPSTGHVWLDGEDVTTLPTQARARRGLGRTFQRMELFDSLSVFENVAMGREAGQAGSNPLRQLVASRAERQQARAAATAALEQCGIAHLGTRTVGELPTGQRRLVELARVLAGTFTLLLLDEPSSGLDLDETHAFGAVLKAVVAERGVGILLVEHDMGLVMTTTDHIYVLDFGQLIFEGTPNETQASELVRRAYLGEEAA